MDFPHHIVAFHVNHFSLPNPASFPRLIFANHHVEAETDMDLWVLKRSHFEDISKKDPEVLNFLTEIVAARFDSRRPTAYRTIGKYIATDIIGRGGFSIVYKGMHKSLNLPVAIKMMRHDMALDTEFIENFHLS